VKKSELEQIIIEEIEAVIAENILKKKIFNPAYNYVKGKVKKYFKGKSVEPHKPKSRMGLIPLNRISIFSKIKSVEIHQPKLDAVARLDGVDVEPIGTDQAIDWIDRTMRNFDSRGIYEFVESDLLAGKTRRFPLVDVGKKDFEGAELVLKHTGELSPDAPLNIKAVIRKVPLDPKGRRMQPSTVHDKKPKKPKMSYPGDGPGMDLIPVGPNARGRTMPPPPRPTSGKAKIVNKRLENKQLDTSKDT